MKFKEDSRYRQANREAVISLGMYVLFFAWWYFTAYGLGSGDPGEYTYVLGLPSWFFYSCIVGYIGISLVVWAVVRLFFSRIPSRETIPKKREARSHEQYEHDSASGDLSCPRFAVAVWGKRAAAKTSDAKGFLEEYFLGGRSMGGFVLAMAVITTYTSASSFVGGPGVAFKLGLGWILLAMIQVPTAFLTLGVLGKKFAIVSRKVNAVTITEYLRARYKNELVVVIASLAILVFFMASMLAQFIGGARLFQTVTGYPYLVGLIIFGITVVIYTTVGGFRAVVNHRHHPGCVMICASVALLWAVVSAGGGMEKIMAVLRETDPALLTPTGPGNAIPRPFILSFWVLVGFAVLGLPQTTQKCLGFRDARSMNNGMIIGTFVVGFLMLTMHLVGALGRAVLPGIEVGDLAVPTITVKLLSPFWAGFSSPAPSRPSCPPWTPCSSSLRRPL